MLGISYQLYKPTNFDQGIASIWNWRFYTASFAFSSLKSFLKCHCYHGLLNAFPSLKQRCLNKGMCLIVPLLPCYYSKLTHCQLYHPFLAYIVYMFWLNVILGGSNHTRVRVVMLSIHFRHQANINNCWNNQVSTRVVDNNKSDDQNLKLDWSYYNNYNCLYFKVF